MPTKRYKLNNNCIVTGDFFLCVSKLSQSLPRRATPKGLKVSGSIKSQAEGPACRLKGSVPPFSNIQKKKNNDK